MNWKLGTTIIVVAGAAAAAFALSSRYVIVPSALSGARANGLAGSFRITRPLVVYDPHRPDQSPIAFHVGIRSDRWGGACIVFRASDLGFDTMAAKQCSSNTDCSNPAPDSVDPNSEEAASYAATPTRREHRYGYCDQGTHQCWAKPVLFNGQLNSKAADDSLCTRRTPFPAGQSPWPVDQDIGLAVAGDKLAGFGLRTDQPIRARLVACLNARDATPKTGCKSVSGPDRMEVLGPPTGDFR